MTLSGLLNVLDGFHAPENVVYVMTTNDAEALDPALLRPGRIDYKLHMGPAGETQKIDLYLRFFPGATLAEATHFAESHAAQTMAEFQGLLLRQDREGWPRRKRKVRSPERMEERRRSVVEQGPRCERKAVRQVATRII